MLPPDADTTGVSFDGLSMAVLPGLRDQLRPHDGALVVPRVGAIVRLQWRDAYFEVDEPEEERDDYLVYTFGEVIKITDKFLHIASEVLPEYDGHRAITAIPLTEITNWKELA